MIATDGSAIGSNWCLSLEGPQSAEDSPGMFAGHLDQHGRVTGRLRVAGQEHRVDCGSVRDRSWGPRVVRSGLRLGNAHGTGSDGAFFAYLQQDETGRERITGGTLHRDGSVTDLHVVGDGKDIVIRDNAAMLPPDPA